MESSRSRVQSSKGLLLACLLAVLLPCALLHAGDYGRIKGRVIDAETKVAVAGAAVEVEGTDYGATTDESGEYLIPAVPGGVQALTASAMGYEPKRISDVLVIVDQTIDVNFTVQATAIMINTPIEAVATPTMVATQTATSHTFTTAQFDKIPVTSLAQIVSLQAGVVNEPLQGMHLRGGRPDEVAYFVDGVNTNDPQYGYQAARVNPEATAEVVVISGGFDAEYGEAMSGIVQVITKEGKDKPSGRIKYTTDEFMPKNVNYGYNEIEGSIGSAFKLGKDRLGYFVSPELDFIGDYSPREYKLPHHNRNDYQLTGKLDYVHSGLKLTGSGFLSREQYDRQPATPDDENNLGFKYDLNHFLSERDRTRTLDLNLDHMLRPNLFYTLRVGYFYDQRVEAVRDSAREATERDYNKRFWEDYIFKGEDSVMSRDSVIYDMRRFYGEQRNDVTENPYGVVGLFYGAGDYRVFLANWSSVLTYKGDLTYNIGKTHEFKGGLEVRQNDIARRYNSLPADPNPFVDEFNYKPVNAAAYVQDRMDFEDLVLRPGLRLDYLDPNAYKKANPADVEDTTMLKALPKYKVSPRIGVSFPISERSKFRFSYGQFFQTPDYQFLYDDIGTAAYLRGNNIIGNPDLQAQQTVAYELGVETELTRIFALDFTAYYKDIYNLLGVRYESALPIGYYPYENEDYGNVRGIEVTLDKALTSYWSGEISYSLSMARGTESYATEWYYERYRYGIDPITGQEMVPPKTDYYLDFDERNTVKADLTLQFPHDFSAVILRDFQGTLLFTFGSGLPYSVRELKQGLNSGQIIGEEYSARMPPRYDLDTRLSKGIHIGPMALDLVLDITNIFNFRNVEWVYGFTGKPGDDGYAATFSPAEWAGTVPITPTNGTYNGARDLNHDGYISPIEEYTAYKTAYQDMVNNPNNYSAPRQVRLGVNLEF